jgi:hypothetical protein
MAQANATITGEKPVWSRLTNLGSCLNDMMVLEVDKETMRASCVDNSHVAVWEIAVPCEAFAEYAVTPHTWDKEQATGHGLPVLDLEMVKRSLRTLKKPTDLQTLVLLDSGVIELEGPHQKIWDSWSIDGVSRPKMPQLDYDTQVVVPTVWLLDALLAAKDYSDIADFQTNKKEGTLCITGHNDGQRKQGSTTKYTFQTDSWPNESVGCSYSAEWLIPSLRKLKAEKCTSVRLWIAKSYPLKLEAEWDDGMTATLILAPRINND